MREKSKTLGNEWVRVRECARRCMCVPECRLHERHLMLWWVGKNVALEATTTLSLPTPTSRRTRWCTPGRGHTPLQFKARPSEHRRSSPPTPHMSAWGGGGGGSLPPYLCFTLLSLSPPPSYSQSLFRDYLAVVAGHEFCCDEPKHNWQPSLSPSYYFSLSLSCSLFSLFPFKPYLIVMSLSLSNTPAFVPTMLTLFGWK